MTTVSNIKLYTDRTTPLAFEISEDVAARVSYLCTEYMGCEIDYKMGRCGTGQVATTFTATVDTPYGKRLLSVPERAIVEAFARYCSDYTAGLRRSESVTLPKVIQNSNGDPINREHCLAFKDEARAYMFAETVESCFGFSAEVVEVPLGWAVVIDADDGLSAEDMAELQGAYCVLQSYRVERAGDATACGEAEIKPCPESRRAWRDGKLAQLQRIEDATNAILARLGQSEASGVEGELQLPKTPNSTRKKPSGAAAAKNDGKKSA